MIYRNVPASLQSGARIFSLPKGSLRHGVALPYSYGLLSSDIEAIAKNACQQLQNQLAVTFPVAVSIAHHQFRDTVDSASAKRWRQARILRQNINQKDALLQVIVANYSDDNSCLLLVGSRKYFTRQWLMVLAHRLLGNDEQCIDVVVSSGAESKKALSQVTFDESGLVSQWNSHDVSLQNTRRSTLPAYHHQIRHWHIPQSDFTKFLTVLSRVVHGFCGFEACGFPVLIDKVQTSDGLVAGLAWFPGLMASEQTVDEELNGAEQFLQAPVWIKASDDADVNTESLSPFLGVILNQVDASIAGIDKFETYCAAQHLPFPVTLDCQREDDGLTVNCYCRNGMLSKVDIDTLGSALTWVAEQFIESLQKQITSLSLASTLYSGKSIETQVEAALPYQRIEQFVSHFAQSQPDSVAVFDDNHSFTYANLEQLTNQLAVYLQHQGVRRGQHVGVKLSRSVYLVVTALAIMKVGAVYVPMDPEYPQDRLEYTCNDANLTLLISDADKESLEPVCGVLLLQQWLQASAELKGVLAGEETHQGSDPAYIIYTSGSTGKPKGVSVPHHNVAALINGLRDDYALGVSDVWSMFHSFAFDFSVWEVWGALLTGGSVFVVSYDDSRNPSSFITKINQHRISIVSQIPSAFNQLVESEQEQPVTDCLRLVVFGGEALEPAKLLPWFDRHPETECQLVNMYGITETTVHVTALNLNRRHTLHRSRSVGRAIKGWDVVILDPNQHPVPIGIAGEIYVGGAGVALGYHNRAELTAERFITNPWGEGRLYRSGDKGRMLPDGEIEHLGRLDNQVKLRGFRIELDEICNLMLGVEAVSDGVVVFSQDDPNDSATAHIDAFALLNGDSFTEVWQVWQEHLPAFMIPSSLSSVAKIPLTANGKLDTKNITNFVIQRTTHQTNVTPAVEPETKEKGDDTLVNGLIQIWSELFEQEVTAEDNFFDLGGNSLFAIRMSRRARELGLPDVNLRELYRYQTINNLSKVLG